MHVIFERHKPPNYFDGRLLSAADLRAEQDYCRNKIAAITACSTAVAWSAACNQADAPSCM